MNYHRINNNRFTTMKIKGVLKIGILVFAILACISGAYAQKGTVYLQNYDQKMLGSNALNNALIYTNNNRILVANTKGATQYNGDRWSTIPAKSTLYTLYDDSTVVYVGGRSDFGYLKLQATGRYQYASLAKSSEELPKELGNFTFIGQAQEHIYFLSEKALVQVKRKNQKITQVWKATANQTFQALITFRNVILVNIQGAGLHRVQGKSLKPFGQASPFKDITINASFAVDGAPWVTTSDNKVYMFDGERWQKVVCKDQKYLDEHTLTDGVALGKDRVALGTLNGGVLIIHWKSGETLHIINHETGLPDDEVLGLSVDPRDGLWILHAQGITQALLELPINKYSEYPGLIGSPTSAVYWQKKLYVATTEGLFQLKKTNSFADLVTPIRSRQPGGLQVQSTGGTVVGNLINDVFGKRKRATRVFKRPKGNGKKGLRKKLEDFNKRRTNRRKRNRRQRKRKNVLERQDYALLSFPHYYQKVSNFSLKVNQLVPAANALLIATNQGLYTLKANTVKPVFEGGAAYKILRSPKNKSLVYVGTSQGVKSLTYKNGNWVADINFDKLQAPVYSLVFVGNELWLGSDNRVFKVQVDAAGHYKMHKEYGMSRYYLEEVQVVNLKGKPTLFLSNGIYSLDAKKQQFVLNTQLKISQPSYQLIQRQAKYTWSNIGQDWQNLQDSSRVGYVSLFDQVNDIYEDEAKNLWVVHQNGLHKIAPRQKKDSIPFEVLLTQVYNHKRESLSLDRIRLYQGSKAYSIHFVLGTSDYVDEQATRYRYRLKGVTNGWSNWKNDAQIDFTFLPSGRHTLEVQAKNALGQLSKTKVIGFRVVPPFWKRWWFYLLEIFVLGGLIAASAVSNRFNKYKRYSSLLTFVTIITIFEYIVLSIEPTVDNFSGGVPVFKLLMNIILAMSLNPLERRFSAWLSRQSFTNDEGEKEG